MRILIIYIFSLIMFVEVNGQTYKCHYWPAPCSQPNEIEDARDSSILVANLNTTQEIKMANGLRVLVESIAKGIADKNHWEYYELKEQLHHSAGQPAEPFEKRPPAGYYISYVFIANPLKLKEWGNYLDEFHNKMSEYGASLEKPLSNPGKEKREKDLNDSLTLSLKYRDSSVVLVTFTFNGAQTSSGVPLEDGYGEKLPDKKLEMPGVQYAGLAFTNKIEPHMEEVYASDYHYPSTEALILVGGWNTKADLNFYNVFYAQYANNKINTDHKTIKKITCDQVQSEVIHIQSNSRNILKAIHAMDVTPLINILKK